MLDIEVYLFHKNIGDCSISMKKEQREELHYKHNIGIYCKVSHFTYFTYLTLFIYMDVTPDNTLGNLHTEDV